MGLDVLVGCVIVCVLLACVVAAGLLYVVRGIAISRRPQTLPVDVLEPTSFGAPHTKRYRDTQLPPNAVRQFVVPPEQPTDRFTVDLFAAERVLRSDDIVVALGRADRKDGRYAITELRIDVMGRVEASAVWIGEVQEGDTDSWPERQEPQ